ncbi:MAG: hypothetical protein PGN26_00390 [Xylophilus ampelinus]
MPSSPTHAPDPQTARDAPRPDGEPAGPGNDDRGNTRVQQLATGSGNAVDADMRDTNVNTSNPRLPHERDQSSDNQADHAAHDDAMSEKAYQDATGPQQDTGLAPVTDDTYNNGVREGDGSRGAPRN